MIFVDETYLLALVDRDSEYFDEAMSLFADRAPGELWVTSHLVLARLWDEIASRVGALAAIQMLDRLTSSLQLRIVPVTGAQQAQSFGLVRSQLRPPLSYLAATTIVVMRSLGIRKIQSFAGNLERAGLDPVRD